MKKIFTSGEFNDYKSINLNESRQPVTDTIRHFYDSNIHYTKREITVFISHRHKNPVMQLRAGKYYDNN